MQVTDGNGYIYGPNGLQVNGSDGRPKVLSTGGSSGIPHGIASGTDTYTVAITGATSYADGDAYLVRFTNGNTTGSTLNINGLGAVALYRNNDGELIGGDIQNGAEMLCVYNSTLNVFQVIGTSPNTLLAYVTNSEAITITKGQPVYAFGGQGDRLKVKLAYNTSDATSAQTVGLVLSTSIGANQKGFIILNGQLDGLSILPTSTWADGDPVYLGATAGSITKTKPKAPNHLVYLGFVTTASNGSAGRMYVRVQNGYEMDELHDVQITSVANNDLIQYDSASSLWKNRSISSAGIQDTLVSGTNIKSINGNSLLGSGDLTISTSASWGSITGTLSSQTDLNTALSGKASTGAVTGTGITMSTARILGRSTAGTGAIEEITIGSGLTLSAGTLSASGGSSSLTIGTTAIASGTVGRILFEGTGNVLQESANLFWDNTNGRLGIGTASPNMSVDIRTGNVGIGVTSDAGFKLDVNGTARVSGALTLNGGTGATKTISEGATYGLLLWGGTGSNADLTLTDRSGNLRFRIVNGANILQTATTINDVLIGGTSFASKSIYTSGTYGFVFGGYSGTSYHISLFESTGTNGLFVDSAGRAKVGAYNSAFNNSAILEAVSTTRGFLPPRMTTTQKNAITTPAAGLVVYDTTLNKLCVRTASAWETITSL